MDSVITKREAEFLGIAIGMPYRFKRDMPFIIAPAVSTAAAAIGAAAATTTLATVGAAAVSTIGAIGAVATVAGIGMSVVGMITGDQSLMKIGGIVGLAGGVGSIASGLALGAGGLSAAASASSAPAASGGVGAMGGAGSIAPTATNAITPQFSSIGADAVNQSMNTGAQLAQSGTQGIINGTQGMFASPYAVAGVTNVAPSGVGLSSNVVGTALDGGVHLTNSLANAGSTLPNVTNALSSGGGSITASGSFFDQLLSNPTAMMSGLKMVADGVGNMGNGKVRDAEANFYNSKAANFPLENAIANRKIDADIAKSEAELKLTQQKLDDERKERDRKIENFNAMVQVPTMRGVMR